MRTDGGHFWPIPPLPTADRVTHEPQRLSPQIPNLLPLGGEEGMLAMSGEEHEEPAVPEELHDARRPPAVRQLAAQLPGWLDVRPPQRREVWSGLHAGEAEALSLAVEAGAELLLMDEKEGRRIATERHLLVAGTVGVLERAAAQDLLDLREAFERLKQTDFWVKSALLDSRLEAFERQRGRGRIPGLGH